MILTGTLALVTSSIFTGAAFYINFAEQPARLLLDDKNLLKQWKPSYYKGFIMQASIAVISGVLGLLTMWQTNNWLWAVGSIFILANWPYTLLCIMPTNNKLNAIDDEQANSQSRTLIKRWGYLHTVRTVLGMAATLSFILASI